jgi:hypothetical protein
MNSTKNSYAILNKIIREKNFSNVKRIFIINNLEIYQADSDGENFLLAFKNSNVQFSGNDIDVLYEKSKKFHIHNIIVISNSPIPTTSVAYKKIKDYGIDIWNNQETEEVTKNTVSYKSSSVIKTNNTSNDNCDIDDDPFDPIQDGTFHTHSLFSIFNDKTEKL